MSVKNRKIRISTVRDNNGTETKVYANLEPGDKLIAKRSVSGIGDIGMSGLTFRYEAFIPNKTYKVHHTYLWDFVRLAYVMDEDGSVTWATPDIFDLVNLEITK